MATGISTRCPKLPPPFPTARPIVSFWNGETTTEPGTVATGTGSSVPCSYTVASRIRSGLDALYLPQTPNVIKAIVPEFEKPSVLAREILTLPGSLPFAAMMEPALRGPVVVLP